MFLCKYLDTKYLSKSFWKCVFSILFIDKYEYVFTILIIYVEYIIYVYYIIFV